MQALLLFYSRQGEVYRHCEAVADGLDQGGVPSRFARMELPGDESDGLRPGLAEVPIASADDIIESQVIILGVPPATRSLLLPLRRLFHDAQRRSPLTGHLAGIVSTTATPGGLDQLRETLLGAGMLVAGSPAVFAPEQDPLEAARLYGATLARLGRSREPEPSAALA